ncbi:MAG: DUF2268 domain-containing putative Zn-dependent protease [Candidatus Pacebacteria bacterium]|nr:DUF2268 domain-containing putative Zn-dependent protease [Candidatus Paceibacterota bacterium]
MDKDLIRIEFYFPEKKKIKNKRELADLIMEEMREKKSISYSGHIDEEGLKKGLIQHISDGDISGYSVLTEKQKEEVEKVIKETIDKCNKKLPIPTKNYIFIFPFLPAENENVFKGVVGVAQYSCVFHIFLNPNVWTPKALANSVAHELNHTIFYYNHYNDFENYTLLDEIIMEGLAENFRERIVDLEPSPWVMALTKEEAFLILGSLESRLFSKDKDLIKDVLFGNEKYKKWTGYSVGYWLVKEYLNKNPDFLWKEIIKKDSEDFLEKKK